MGWLTDKLKEKLHLDKDKRTEQSYEAGQNSRDDTAPSALQTSATKDELAGIDVVPLAVKDLAENHASTPLTAKAIVADELAKNIGKDESPLAPMAVAQDTFKDSVLTPVAADVTVTEIPTEDPQKAEMLTSAHVLTSNSQQSSSDTITPRMKGHKILVVTEAPLARTISMIAEAEADPESKHTSPMPGEETTPRASEFPRAEDTVPQTLSQAAFEALDPSTQAEVRTLLPDAGLSQASVSIDYEIRSLTAIVKTRQDDCEEKFWKVKIFGQDVVIRDYVKASVGIIEKAGDVAINFAPAPGSVVWSGVKTLMQMYITGEAELCALLTVAQIITPVLSRVQAYETMFTGADTGSDALDKLTEESIKIYSICFQLLAHTSKELASKVRRARHALLKPGEGSNMIKKLQDQEREHNRAVQQCHAASGVRTNKKLEFHLKQLLTAIEASTVTLQKVEAGVDRLVASDRERELDWISEVKYTTDHEAIQGLRAENTCKWLVRSKQFEAWEATPGSSVLWLRGDVGTGKSVLSSSIVDHLRERCASSIEDGGIAFFYCNRQIEDRKTSSSVLRTFVRQLSTTYRSGDDIRPELRAACIERKRKGGHLDAKACETQILASIDMYPFATIVLDGLDECSETDRKVLLATIGNLINKAQKTIKIYIASRPNVDIEKAIQKLPHIEISSGWNTQQDIRTYVERAIDGHENWNDEEIFQIQPDTKKLIIDTLSGETFTSRPMFRWAYLQLQQLFPKRSDEDIKAKLGKLPKDLDGSYAEIYENNTKDLGERDKAHVDRAFMWVMCSKYPMPRERLPEAICMTPTGTRDEGEVKAKALLQLCQHLLVSGTAWYDQNWRFPHASVAEYFEQKHWTMAAAHGYVARVCLSQMMSFYETFDPVGLKERRLFDDQNQEYTAIDYVRYCWHYHVQEAQSSTGATMSIDEDMKQLLKSFLGSPSQSSTQFRRWIMHAERTFDGDKMARHLDYSGLRHMLPSTMSLFTMIHFNFTTSLSDWWEAADIDVGAINVMGETPLAVSRSIEVSELLLKRGADVTQGFMWRSFNNEPFEPRYNILTAAVGRFGIPENGLPMVKLLVQAGAEIDKASPEQPDNNALNKAVSLRLVDIMTYLIDEAKANVNVELPKTSVLITAASEGVVDTIRYLVGKGADVSKLVPNSPAGTPLASAAFSGHLEVVKLFIEEFKVDPNELIAHQRYGSVLASASNIEIVRYLVKEACVDVNMLLKHGNYGSALASHAAYGHLSIVKFLIEEGGADPKMVMEGRRHRTALEAAKASGEFAREVVEYLDPSAKRLRINTGISGLRKDGGIRRLAKRGTFDVNAFNPLEEATPLTPVGGLGIRKLPKRGSF